MEKKTDVSQEEDLGLDDVESFREFTPYNRKIKLNRTSKPPQAEVIVEPSDNLFKNAIGRIKKQVNLPAPIRKKKENGNTTTTLEEKTINRPVDKPAAPIIQRLSVDEKTTAPLEARRPSRENNSKTSRERSLERNRTRRRRSRSRSRSRSRDNRRRGKSSRRSHSRSRSRSPPRKDWSNRLDPNRRLPDPRGPQYPVYNNMGYFPPNEMANRMGPWGNIPLQPQCRSNLVDVPYEETPEDKAKKIAIEMEARQQKQTFIDQYKEYLKRRKNLLEELQLLKNQRRELIHDKSPENTPIINKNIKLQEETVGKLKSVDNVLDMLKGIIGEHKSPERTFNMKVKNSRSRSESPSNSDDSDGNSEPQKSLHVDGKVSKKEKVNYSFYDPEVHWCKVCNKFPPTAKEYLLHLHSEEHRAEIQKQEMLDLPWHKNSEHKEPTIVEGLPSKRVPIKGLQFFTPSTAWYCKLCNSWMGDLHCASLHLKSKDHDREYSKNPAWELTWLSDRGQAVLSTGKKEDILKRQMEEQMLLQKKHKDELRYVSIPLIAPSQPTKFAVKEKNRKSKKNRKRRKRESSVSSSSSSGSSSSTESSSSSSSSSSDGKSRKKKVKKNKKNKLKQPIKFTLPEKSKMMNESYMDDFKHKEIVKTVPERHTIVMPDSPKRITSPTVLHMYPTTKKIERPHEFEFKTRREVKKKSNSVFPPQSKFGFIGRMPFARKLKDNEERKKEEPTPPPPPMIGNNPISGPSLKSKAAKAKELITMSQRLMEQNNVTAWSMDLIPMDMDIDSPNSTMEMPAIPPPPPMIRKKTSHSSKPLPSDFEEALSIIYNEPAIPEAPPPPHLADEDDCPPTPSPPRSLSIGSNPPELDDMALLGIVSGDMAAQRI